jgi:hypothetical protein
MRERRVWRFLVLYVYTLGDGRDRREGNDSDAQGDEAFEGSEGNGDNFGTSRCAAHEDGVKGAFSDWKSLASISERYHLGLKWTRDNESDTMLV